MRETDLDRARVQLTVAARHLARGKAALAAEHGDLWDLADEITGRLELLQEAIRARAL